tara:strand:+ start:543 stop:1025 length:483 start_codon:yes stop_codon:yes gene_type:complete
MKRYHSSLQLGYQDTSVEASFKLEKIIHCGTLENKNAMVEKLDRLKTEDFNRVSIPDFDYHVDNNTVTYNVDFIKGYGIGTLIPKYADIVYEDVVQRESDWVFHDLATINFIVEFGTEKIYAIDFQSYACIPDHRIREIKWEESRANDTVKVNGMLSGIN